jgi:pyruvate dehydrogenase E1 component alpha subunit
MDGRSITLTFPEYRVISSAIVGGIIPIALGLAWAIKRKGGAEKVWCFVGDMTETGGAFHEATFYADGHDLPITFVRERNGKSVLTDTDSVWGGANKKMNWPGDVTWYNYDLSTRWPHAGAGKRVEF